jgi:DNA-directed RNA polymerase subunit RPC12/RpoP
MGHEAFICRSCGKEFHLTEIQSEVDDTMTCPNCQHTSFGI